MYTCRHGRTGLSEREKIDGNELVEEGKSPPLDLGPNEVIEADEETLPYAEEDWHEPEQMEAPKNLEQDLPFTIHTRQNDRIRSRKKYNPYSDDFLVDRIDLKKIVEEVVGLEEIVVSQDIDIVDDHDEEWVDDRSKPEVEFDDEQQQSYEQDLTNLRVLEWLNEMTSDPKETSVTIQDVDRGSLRYVKTETRRSFLSCPGGATTHSGFQPRFDIRYAIDGDVDGFFYPESGGRNYPH